MMCLATVGGCAQCAEHPWRGGPHTCDDLCSTTGEAMRRDPAMHAYLHAPVRCHGCGALLDDRRGNDRVVSVRCPADRCWRWCCPDCGRIMGEDRALACTQCNPPPGWLGRLWCRVAEWSWRNVGRQGGGMVDGGGLTVTRDRLAALRAARDGKVRRSYESKRIMTEGGLGQFSRRCHSAEELLRAGWIAERRDGWFEITGVGRQVLAAAEQKSPPAG